MNCLCKGFKLLALITCLIFCANAIVVAQQKQLKSAKVSRNFAKTVTKANIAFAIPDGFKEIADKGIAGPFDYGITLPGQDFEVWFKVFPQDENTPDSLYLNMGKNEAKLLSGENEYLMRNLTDDVLTDYNADAGKTYFINLPDSPVTRHYKFALLITLQKNNKGIVMAAGLTNDKGPDFFKNLNRARYCLKFKGPAS